ncbi:hypothetical protein AHiyo4_34640 [Arthrobacter sp. Hiyo4]|nr:hypothetical protein AHiyo4_34640 [Arthrobacter sp. Hiyo4]
MELIALKGLMKNIVMTIRLNDGTFSQLTDTTGLTSLVSE